MNELLLAGARDLARRIRNGEVTPRDLVDLHIQRIEAVNPSLNALVADRFEAARRDADTATEMLAQRTKAKDLPPLFGVPCTIKEFFAFQGMPWTGGIPRRRDHRANTDSTVVRRLKAAGAIVLGASNVPEGGLWLETHNLIYGRTNNPWNPSRTPGGSSGGEGALVASGASPFGIGSDIGGSIRIPAAFCGVPGHKPSGRLVPNTGHFPPALGEAGAFLCAGPLARRVEDLEVVLRSLAGPDGEDPVCRAMTLKATADVDLSRLVVIPIETNGHSRMQPVMRRAIRAATSALEDRGAKVERRGFKLLRKSFEIWSSMLSASTDSHYASVLGGGHPISIWRELLALPFGRAHHSYPALVMAALDELTSGMEQQRKTYCAAGRRLQAQLESALGPNGVILHPPYTRPAPRHNEPWLHPMAPACTAIFNVMEFPATHVPVGRDRHGLPVGVQVVAARGHDHLTLAAAGAIEAAYGGWRPATLGAQNPTETPRKTEVSEIL